MRDMPYPTLSDVAQASFSWLLRTREATRKMIAEAAGISLPTVTAAMAELSARGMVTELRREQGARGRATLVYGVDAKAGWVLGVDIGSTQLTLLARCLNGDELERASFPHTSSPPHSATLAGNFARQMIDRHENLGVPLALGLALNQVVPRQLGGTVETTITDRIVDEFAVSLGRSAQVPILVENNVNCAAVAEHQDGGMRGVDDAAYMQIGVGIGLGFFCDGALIRGGQGASGELAQIPVSWHASEASPRHAIEARYGASGLIRAAQAAWPEGTRPPATTEELFSLALGGQKMAKQVMLEHGVALGRIAAAAATLLDPTVLVIGGGLIRNASFAQIVVEEFRVRNLRTQINVSEKGAGASAEGACMLARDLALRLLVKDHHRPLLQKPAVYSGA